MIGFADFVVVHRLDMKKDIKKINLVVTCSPHNT